MKEETTRKGAHGAKAKGSEAPATAKGKGAEVSAAEAARMKNRDRQEVQQLIALGKQKGHLTYDEINEALPTDAFSPDQIDELMVILGDEEIDIVDASTQVKVAPKRAAEEDQEKRVVPIPEEEDAAFEDAYASKSNDPVRMYLRKMGSVSLLTREGEVEIAKRIEDGENKVLNTILQSPIAVQEIIRLGDKVKQRKVRLKDVVRDADDEEGYNEEEVRKRVERLTDRVKKLWTHILELEESFDGPKKLSDTRKRQVHEEIARTQSEMCQTLQDLRLNKKQIEHIVAQLKKLIDQLERADTHYRAARYEAALKNLEELGRHEPALRKELQEALNRTYRRALEAKARELGEVESLQEQGRADGTYEVTVVVKA